MSPLVSIVIPCYNQGTYLGEAIDSVLAQTCQDFEIIVINDGSTDNTAEVIARHGGRVRNQYHANRGRSAARNEGISAAEGKYLAFLDADDVFLPEKIELQAAFLNTHPGIGVVYSDGLLFDDVNGFSGASNRLFSEAGFLTKDLGCPPRSTESLAIENRFPIHSALVRRECLEQAGGFDETLHMYEDWDLWFRVAHHCGFHYLDAVVAKYRISATNTSRDATSMFAGAERVRSKIERDEAFPRFSSATKAQFYYIWGKSALAIGQPEKAASCFRRAVGWRSSHWLARALLLLVLVFGEKASAVFSLKRAAFSLARHPKRRFYWSAL